METVVLVIVALIVAIVAIDGVAKLHDVRAAKRPDNSQTIIVDLTRRQ